MADPYTKKPNGENWAIEDGDGHVIATTETETLADFVMASLLMMYPMPPDYPSDEPQSIREDPAARRRLEKDKLMPKTQDDIHDIASYVVRTEQLDDIDRVRVAIELIDYGPYNEPEEQRAVEELRALVKVLVNKKTK